MFVCTLFAELCCQGTTMNLKIVLLLVPPKNPCLNQATPKNSLSNFPTPKNLRIENFKPRNILQSSPSLEILSTPPPPGLRSSSRCPFMNHQLKFLQLHVPIKGGCFQFLILLSDRCCSREPPCI